MFDVEVRTYVHDESLLFPEKRNHIILYLIQVEALEDQESDCYAILDGRERRRAAAFAGEELRRRYTCIHGAKRRILGDWLGKQPANIHFEISRFGKPGIAGDSVNAFNLSHSENVALLALGIESNLGVDIEQIRSGIQISGLARHILTADEMADFNSLTSLEQISAFYRYWCGKEAALKADGSGFMVEPGRVELTRDAESFTVRWLESDKKAMLKIGVILQEYTWAVARMEP